MLMGHDIAFSCHIAFLNANLVVMHLIHPPSIGIASSIIIIPHALINKETQRRVSKSLPLTTQLHNQPSPRTNRRRSNP